ncbi:MAG: nucleotidyl transferase AbiEii/AbiGii toxin family protein [Chlamydiota bacterium]
MNEQALKDRIKNIAREKGIQFNECWKKLLLERFLLRLSRSDHHNKFIFKGGFLLSYMMEIGRETVDLDFLFICMKANENEVKKAMIDVASIQATDGFLFHYEGMSSLEQPHMKYPGYRVDFEAKFGRVKDRIHIDIGIGDVVSPSSRDLNLALVS